MSRAYRVRVQESLSKVVCAEDHVSCQLEMLELLPCEQLAQLLAAELAKLGFAIEGDQAVRSQKGVRIEVDLIDATVTASTEGSQSVKVKGDKSDHVYDQPSATQAMEKSLREELKGELNQKIDDAQAQLQRTVTDRLEAQLGDVRVELDGAVNRVTAQALKIKAAQLGQIKAISEDPASGSLTIVVEV